jgi:ribonuclease HI
MNDRAPHYLLISEASRTKGLGQWRFVLRATDSSASPVEVGDVEPDVWGERLDLLTVIRALESLDQPSQVTLLGCSRYVREGIQYGLPEWRDADWRWERFGEMVAVRDADLWQRMDRILQIHRVDCGQRRIDGGHNMAGPHWPPRERDQGWVDRIASNSWLKCVGPLLVVWGVFWVGIALRLWQVISGVRGQGSEVRNWLSSATRF